MNAGLGRFVFVFGLGVATSAICQHTGRPSSGSEDLGQRYEKCESSSSGAMSFRQLSTGRFDGGQKLTADDLLFRRRLLRQMVQTKDLATCFAGVPLMELCSLISLKTPDKARMDPKNLKADDFRYSNSSWQEYKLSDGRTVGGREHQSETRSGTDYLLRTQGTSSITIQRPDNTFESVQASQGPSWLIRSTVRKDLWGSVSDSARGSRHASTRAYGHEDLSRDGFADTFNLVGKTTTDANGRASSAPSISISLELPAGLRVLRDNFEREVDSHKEGPRPARLQSFDNYIDHQFSMNPLLRGPEAQWLKNQWRRYRAARATPKLKPLIERIERLDSNQRCLDPVLGDSNQLLQEVAAAVDWNPETPWASHIGMNLMIGAEEGAIGWAEGFASTVQGIAQLGALLADSEKRKVVWDKLVAELTKGGVFTAKQAAQCAAMYSQDPWAGIGCVVEFVEKASGQGFAAVWKFIYEGMLVPIAKCFRDGADLVVGNAADGAGREFGKCMGNVSFMAASSAFGSWAAGFNPVLIQGSSNALVRGVGTGVRVTGRAADELFGFGVNSLIAPPVPSPTRAGNAAADFVSQAPPASGTKAAEASLTEAATKAATDATKDAAANVVKEAATDAATDTAADAATQAAASAGSDAATQVSESAASSAASSTTASTTSGAIANQGLQYPGGRTPAQMESVLNDKALHRSVYSSHLKDSLKLSDKELTALPWDKIWDLHLKQGPGLGVIATPDGKLSAESALKVTREKVLPLVKILEDSGVPWERSRDIARSLADSGGLGLPPQNKIADSLLGVDQATASLTARKAQSTVLELQETGFRHSAGTPINPSSLDLAEEAAKDASNLAYRIDSDLQTATGNLAFGSKLNGISARSQKPGHLSLDFDSANKGSRIEIVLEAQPQSNQVKVIAREPGRSEFAKVVDLKPDEIARFKADTKRVEPHAESGTWARLSRNISGTKTTDDLIGSEGSASVILRRFQQQMDQAQSDIRRVRSTLGETRADFKTAVENHRSQLVQSVQGEQALTHSEVFNKSLLESADFAARATDEELQEFVTQLQQRSVAKSESLLKSRRRLQSSVEGMSWSTARDRPQALADLQKEREAHLRLIREQSAISGEGAAYARELELRRSRTAPVPQGQAVAKAPKLLPAPPERPLLPAPPAPLKPTEVGHYRNQLLPQKGDDLGIVPNAETGPLESIIDDSVVTRFVDSLKDVRDSPEALRAARQALLMDRPDLADKVSAEIILATSQGGKPKPGFEQLAEVFKDLPRPVRAPASSTTLGSFFGNVAERVFDKTEVIPNEQVPPLFKNLSRELKDPETQRIFGLRDDSDVLITGSHGVTGIMGIPTPARSGEVNLIVPANSSVADIFGRIADSPREGLPKVKNRDDVLDILTESQHEIELMARNLAEGRPTIEGLPTLNVPLKDAFLKLKPNGELERVFIDDHAKRAFDSKRLMLPTAHPERGYATIQQWRDTLPSVFQNESAYTLENTLIYTSVLAARGRQAGWRIEPRSRSQLQEILRVLPESQRPKLREEMLSRLETDIERNALNEVLKEIGFDAAPRAQDLAADAVRNTAADIRDAARTAAHQLLGDNSPLDPPPRHLVPDSVETPTPSSQAPSLAPDGGNPRNNAEISPQIRQSLTPDLTQSQLFDELLPQWRRIPDIEFEQALDATARDAEELSQYLNRLKKAKNDIETLQSSGDPKDLERAQDVLDVLWNQNPTRLKPDTKPAGLKGAVDAFITKAESLSVATRQRFETIEYQQRMAMLAKYADEGVIEFIDPPANPTELWNNRIKVEHKSYPANPFSDSLPVVSFRVKDPSKFNILCRSGELKGVWSTFCASRRYLSASLNRDLYAASAGYDTFTRFQPNAGDVYHFGGVAPQASKEFEGLGGATQLWRSRTANKTNLVEKPLSEGGNIIRKVNTIEDPRLREVQVQFRDLFYNPHLAREKLPEANKALFRARAKVGQELAAIDEKVAVIERTGGPTFAGGVTPTRKQIIANDLEIARAALLSKKKNLVAGLETLDSELSQIIQRHGITNPPPRIAPQVTDLRPALSSDTLILDTNLASDASKTISALKVHDQSQRRALGQLIGNAFGDRPRGAGKPDLRVADFSAQWELEPDMSVGARFNRMPASTNSELKERIALRLSKLNVGQGKAGAGDRAILAGALSAPRGAGVVPSFATADSAVFYKFRSFVPAKDQNLPPAEFAKRYFPRGFEIEIEGQKLRIIPVPSN